MVSKTNKPDTLSSSIYEEMRQDILVGRLKAGEMLAPRRACFRNIAA